MSTPYASPPPPPPPGPPPPSGHNREGGNNNSHQNHNKNHHNHDNNQSRKSSSSDPLPPPPSSTESRVFFIGNLPQLKDHEIRRYFNQYAPVERLNLRKSPNGGLRGFGWVTFQYPLPEFEKGKYTLSGNLLTVERARLENHPYNYRHAGGRTPSGVPELGSMQQQSDPAEGQRPVPSGVAAEPASSIKHSSSPPTDSTAMMMLPEEGSRRKRPRRNRSSSSSLSREREGASSRSKRRDHRERDRDHNRQRSSPTNHHRGNSMGDLQRVPPPTTGEDNHRQGGLNRMDPTGAAPALSAATPPSSMMLGDGGAVGFVPQSLSAMMAASAGISSLIPTTPLPIPAPSPPPAPTETYVCVPATLCPPEFKSDPRTLVARLDEHRLGTLIIVPAQSMANPITGPY